MKSTFVDFNQITLFCFQFFEVTVMLPSSARTRLRHPIVEQDRRRSSVLIYTVWVSSGIIFKFQLFNLYFIHIMSFNSARNYPIRTCLLDMGAKRMTGTKSTSRRGCRAATLVLRVSLKATFRIFCLCMCVSSPMNSW